MEYTPYLIHYGVKGMKWGVRRTDAQLARARGKSGASSSKTSDADKEKRRSVAKKVATAAAVGVTVAAAATIYAKNKKAIDSVVAKVTKESVSKISKEAVNRGKAYTKKALGEAYSGVKAGVKEGIHEGSKKVAKTVVTGVMLNTAKRALDSSVGKEEATRIFQANNNKKISSFWKVSSEDKDEDD